jgi:NIPSNAP
MHTIEIRTYRLKPGVSVQFEAAMQNALPMVRAAMDVVAFGRTDHEGQSYFLIRVFASEADLKLKQDAFYSSLAWRNGPREALVQCIDTYLNTIVQMSEQSVDELRSQNGKGLNAS